ncbi:ABC transporter ATP-binding protein [Pelagibius sp. Alg239-R121]|uniref:ABC transporter ATP-binding protein n=1 Tax=Pelagibius sp. Alg239-R121 TaxID=2993448 RepID=UPI0024A65AC4|nr:ABC transporter ATP-binding protein [Pelagibius sp. Alg239-R121]
MSIEAVKPPSPGLDTAGQAPVITDAGNTSARTALHLDAVDKFYGDPANPAVHAVKSFSMEVAEGEIVALLGSSGCGKTSTLRMIAGFETVSRGEIKLAGRRIDELRPAKRNVAMAFEGYSLYPPLTVRDNIAFALKAAKLEQGEVDRKVDHIADLLEIETILGKYPSSLSGGQQQRASLARALIRKADLYLLDEPMSQLEPQLRSVLRGRIKSYLIEHGLTSVFVTHDQTEANALADRIAVMEDGVLQQIASPAELKDRPANLFVATFIGEPPMNVFPARLADDNGHLHVVVEGEGAAAGFTLDLGEVSRPAGSRLTGGAAVHLGVRPHSVSLGRGGNKGLLVSNQWLGDQTHVVIEAAGQTMVAVSYGRVDEQVGAEITFSLSPQAIHLFAQDDGRALLHGTEAVG